jgi:hypothetical protein
MAEARTAITPFRRFWEAIADLPMLDDVRARTYRWILLGVMLSVGIVWLLVSHGGEDATGKLVGTDFIAFWSAGRLAIAGSPDAAYDVARQYAAERAAFAFDPGIAPFYYPPPYLLLCLPLALMPYFAALSAWLAATGLAYVATVRRWLGNARHATLTILAYPAVMVCAGHGQNGFLTTALLGGGLLATGSRPWIAGLLLGSLILKPQLAICLPIALLARREWKIIIATGASASAWIAAATIAFGWSIWQEFLVGGGGAARAQLEQGLVDPAKMVSLFGAIRTLGGSNGIAYFAQICLALTVIGCLIGAAQRGAPAMAQNALLVIATLLISPYMFDYDLTLMALPLAWLFSEGERRGFLRWEKLLLATCFIAPLVLRNIAMSLSLPLAPLLLIALLGGCLRAAFLHRPLALNDDRA